MQYYPSGLPWNDNYQASQQPYKYGGKEFVEMHGLDEYDSEARWYYPALMRTTTQDPLAEKYYDISPYAWCANNPVNLVDPDGRKIIVNEGDEGYKEEVEEQLEELKKMSKELHDLISFLEESENKYYIQSSEEKQRNNYDFLKNVITHDPDRNYVQNNGKIVRYRDARIGLAHELGHAINDEEGIITLEHIEIYNQLKERQNNSSKDKNLYINFLEFIEKDPLYYENIVRKYMGVELRKRYINNYD